MNKKKSWEIEINDVIIYKQKPFIVCDIEKFFKSDLISQKYGDNDEVLPEDSVYTFYHETDITLDGLIETVIEEVSFDKEFYFIGEFKPEFNEAKDSRVITKTLRFKILFRDNFKCKKCGRGAENGIQLHIDHILPYSLGGLTEENNLQTLCIDCNLGKGNKVII
jgi:hypothetical protein